MSEQSEMDDDDGNECAVCGAYLEWVECDQCGGEGFHEVYEEDPLWYDPGDTELCDWCEGKGGDWFCPNFKNHPETAVAQ